MPITLMKIDTKILNKKTTQFKMTENMNRNFSKEDIVMTNKHMKNCSASLLIE